MPELYTDKKIDPFLKWAGGKKKEIKIFQEIANIL